jgi:hypothetical protein
MAEREYKIEAPDGSILRIVGPVDATPDQIRAAAERAFSAQAVSAPAPLPGVCDAVIAALALRDGASPSTFLVTRSTSWSPLSDVHLCTLAAAATALVIVANLGEAGGPLTQEALDEIVAWVTARQHWLVRALCQRIAAASTS